MDPGSRHQHHPPSQGNQTHGIKGFEALELPGINLNSPVINPSESVNSPDEAWPPKGMGAPFDPRLGTGGATARQAKWATQYAITR